MGHWLGETAVNQVYELTQDNTWFKWMSEEDSQHERGEALHALGSPYQFIPLYDDHLSMCKERVSRSTPLAFTGEVAVFDSTHDRLGSWWFDPVFPGVIWFAPILEIPAILWIPVEPTQAGIDKAIQAWVPTKPYINELPNKARFYIGRTDRMNMTVDQIVDDLAANPALSTHRWGSEFDWDPWPENTREWTELERSSAMREYWAMRPGRIEKCSFRSAISGSVISVELHAPDVVFEVNYAPVNSMHIDALNQATKTQLPLDLPVDILAVLIGFRSMNLGAIQEWMELDPVLHLNEGIMILRTLYDDRADFERYLTGVVGSASQEARQMIYEVAFESMLDVFLYEAWEREPSPELRARLSERFLAGNI